MPSTSFPLVSVSGAEWETGIVVFAYRSRVMVVLIVWITL